MTNDAIQRAVEEIESAGDSIIQPRKVSDAGLWQTDLETGKTTLDPSLYRLYGLDPDTFDETYDAWADMVHPEDLPRVEEAWERAVENGDPYQIVYRIVRPDGTVRWIDSRARLITDEDGNPVKMQGLNTDITESQERIQALQVLDRVLRHNLRNTLSVIEGHAEVIEESGTTAVAHHAQKIKDETDQLLETVDKQRTIGSLLSTEQSVETVDLVTVTKEVTTSMSDEFPAAEISRDIPERAEITAVESINEAIREMIHNAIIHNDQETPDVAVTLRTDAEGVTLQVADNGPGIPAVERDLVTGEQEISPLQHASGLGLWLISWVVERSGGIIQFGDRDPRGTVITVSFKSDRSH